MNAAARHQPAAAAPALGPPAVAPALSPAELLDAVRGLRPGVGPSGDPVAPVTFVRLDAADGGGPAQRLPALAAAVAASHQVLVGVAERPVPARLAVLTDALACTLVGSGAAGPDRAQVAVPDLGAACQQIAANVSHSPKAAATLIGLLRVTSAASVEHGLVAESLAYSMLMAGPEAARWRAGRPEPRARPAPEPAVLVERVGDELRLTLNHPGRHNAFSSEIRDQLVEAFELVLLDGSIASVRLAGHGPSFCSGGDLAEFGTAPDVAAAHLIRLDRSVAARIYRCRDRVRAVVHGACIGAGIEIPSFAGRVEARDGAFFQLPELAMGLVPGAGGTVGITRRIGRWRTAYLALSGTRLDLETALDWGLADARAGD